MASASTVCPVCNGRGWRVVESSDGSYAERCECYRAQDSRRRLLKAGVPEGFLHCDLTSFETAHHAHLGAARGVAQEFIDSYPLTGRGGLVFHGPVGTGKTHLAVGIVRALVLSKGAAALFLDFRGLLKTIQGSWNPVSQTSEKEVLDRVLDVDLLALDDLGAEKPSPWVREMVAYLINERYTRAKPVLITTNLRYATSDDERSQARQRMERRLGVSGDQVDDLQDRIGVAALSRLHEMCLAVPLGGVDDYRRTHKTFGQPGGWRLG